jgi:hypothetical protein
MEDWAIVDLFVRDTQGGTQVWAVVDESSRRRVFSMGTRGTRVRTHSGELQLHRDNKPTDPGRARNNRKANVGVCIGQKHLRWYKAWI